MRPRTAQLWRVAAGVAVAVATIGAAGLAAAASPGSPGGGTAAVLPSGPGGPTPFPTDPGPVPSASPTGPIATPSASTCPECFECDGPTATPTPGPMGGLGVAPRARSARLAAFPVRNATATFNVVTNTSGVPSFANPAVVTDPVAEAGDFSGLKVARNSRGCYVLTFHTTFLKCAEQSITIKPDNYTARPTFRVDRVRDPDGDYWSHQYQFTNDFEPGTSMNGQTITITFKCATT